MAETHSTCSTPAVERRQAVRDAGQQVARVWDRLSPVDQASIHAFVAQINAALDPLSPIERMCALDYARAEEAGQ